MRDISPDMEDLLRKASEAYPLKGTDDRWDEIASKINVHRPVTEPKKESVYKKYLASILLLLLFLFLGLFMFDKTGQNRSSKRDSIRTGEAIENINIPQKTGLEKSRQSFTNKSKREGQKQAEEDDVYGLADKNKFLPGKQKPNAYNNTNGKKVDSDKEIANQPIAVSNKDESAATSKRQNTRIEKIVIPFHYPEFSLHPKTLFVEWNNSALSSLQKRGGVYNRGFYYGVVAGPEINNIKKQEIKKAGWNIGLIGGFYFSKKFSVETGVLFSQKYYTTLGDHFSMKEIGPAMPSAMKIIAVNGYSKMIEIPVVFRYNFLQNGKRSFFSAAGFSSYLLTNENNQYHTSMNGAEQMMYGDYKNNKRYFAASIDLGIGYAQNFGNKNNIRFQPYLQIPLKGIGVGDLPITGAGLRVSLTRRAH